MKLQPGHNNSCPVDREIKFSENILKEKLGLVHSPTIILGVMFYISTM